jgi:hypothetical protein
MAQLELFEENDYDINTFLIDSLVRLQALEAVPLIERRLLPTALTSL